MLFGAAISGSALLLLLSLLRHHTAVRAGLGGGWRSSAIVVIALGASLSTAVFPGRTSYPLGLTATLFLLCACGASRLDDVLGGRSAWQRRGWAAYGAIIGWSFVVDLVTREGIVGDRWITYAAAATVWAGTGLLAARVALPPAGIAYAGATLLALMTLPAYFVDSFWTSCNQEFEKCSPAGQLFRSFASSENYVAIVAAFTFVCSIAALRGLLRLLAIFNSFVVLVATGSRTGLVAVGAALGVMLLLGFFRRWRSPVDRVPRAACLLMSATAVVAATYLMFSADQNTLSRRGSIWLAVRSHIDGRVITGLGVSKWSYLQGVGESPQHFFHSGYALALFSGGIIAVVLLGIWFFCLLRGAVGVSIVMAVVPLTTLFMVYSMTEVIWNPLAVDGLTWLAVGLSCVSRARSGERPRILPGGPILAVPSPLVAGRQR
jgi:hypothetical protein